MAAAPASTAFVASRRRLFSALFNSAGIEDVESGLAFQRRRVAMVFVRRTSRNSPAR